MTKQNNISEFYLRTIAHLKSEREQLIKRLKEEHKNTIRLLLPYATEELLTLHQDGKIKDCETCQYILKLEDNKND